MSDGRHHRAVLLNGNGKPELWRALHPGGGGSERAGTGEGAVEGEVRGKGEGATLRRIVAAEIRACPAPTPGAREGGGTCQRRFHLLLQRLTFLPAVGGRVLGCPTKYVEPSPQGALAVPLPPDDWGDVAGGGVSGAGGSSSLQEEVVALRREIRAREDGEAALRRELLALQASADAERREKLDESEYLDQQLQWQILVRGRGRVGLEARQGRDRSIDREGSASIAPLPGFFPTCSRDRRSRGMLAVTRTR